MVLRVWSSSGLNSGLPLAEHLLLMLPAVQASGERRAKPAPPGTPLSVGRCRQQNMYLISGFQHLGCDTPEQLSMERAHAAVEMIFQTLQGLSQTRDHLKQLRSVYTASDGVHQATYRPFLRQVVEEVFHPDRPDCPDIEYMSGGLTDLLKTGFSMFMKVTRPHPGDNPLLIVFLVGGVTASELRLIKEAVSTHKPGSQVLVLSTRLLRPADIAELLFATPRLTPDIGV
ncbi:unnamed protein product, partial [Tetraodon nigroviridis]